MKNENKKIIKLQIYIDLLDMFWKIVVLKTDKISSLKITYKKDARMVSFACAFRTVARLKILVG